MKKSIYIIKNKINEKVYIGQTVNLEQRWAQYKSAVKKEKTEQIIFKAMIKYGIENFWMEPLEENIENYDEREQYWISYYNSRIPNGYNIAPGGQGVGNGTNSPSASIQDENILKQLIDDIIVSEQSLRELAKKYNISYGIINEINQGHTYYNSNLNYPLRDGKKYSPEKLKQITYALKYELDLSLKDIASEYEIDTSFLNDINQGKAYHRDYLTYPIRKGKMIKAKEDYPKIKEMLLHSDLSQKEIAQLFNRSANIISDINLGKRGYDPNLTYPLRVNGQLSKGCITPALLSQIEKDLMESDLSCVAIGKKYNISKNIVLNINSGKTKKYKKPELTYPLRKK